MYNLHHDFMTLAERKTRPISNFLKKLADRLYIVRCNQHADACL
jgi:hypothetical protein